MTADVLVIGAGIVGAFIAAALAQQGQRVHVLSALSPGDGATAAGMGHLVVLDDDPAELALSRWSLALWRQSGHLASGEYRDCGTLWLATEDHELPALRAKQQRLQQAGIGCEWLDERTLAIAEPVLRRGLAAGLRVAGDGVIYAPRVARSLLGDEGRGRIAWAAGATVQRVLPCGVQLADGRRIGADAIVIAAGLDSARLLPELRFVPRKGHLAITDRCALPLRHQVVEVGYGASAHGSADSIAFNLQPRPTGQLLIGSCRQVGRDDRAIDAAVFGRMVGRSIHFVPGLADVPVLRAWTGVRPGSADGRPCIGRWPLLPGVWVAAGHEGLGITTAPATAQLLVAQMLGRDCPIDAAPFDPARMLLAVEEGV
ncbi:FAD-binding oxidoreductase [Aquincola sp. S2]|uniref:FAD-binding oxidoreductase n=1 Tax=Pseudaquabacterium terrae TaxID=2732868 RepID=A0ABX2EFF0_9BURK|nr:FAD-binding oxidoreductase [Aquabacterium terrae]